jgi:protein phosphatase-4 regulatory subunit 3
MLVAHVMENYSHLLDQINYVQTFKALRLRYEQNQDRVKERVTGVDNVPALLRNNRFRRDPRQVDEEEEMWFNDDDDIEEGDGVVPASNSSTDVMGRTKATDPDSQLESLGKWPKRCQSSRILQL